MKKNTYYLILLFVVTIFIANCSPQYIITAEYPKKPDLKKYKQIHVGWLNLDASDWKRYGYDSKKAWKVAIKEMNTIGVQKFLKEDFLIGKKITGAKSKKRDKMPKKGGLYVKFINATYEQNWSYFTKQPDKLTVSMEFYDIKTKKRIYRVSVTTWSKESGFQFGGMSTGSITFEARLNSCVYDISRFIGDKIKG